MFQGSAEPGQDGVHPAGRVERRHPQRLDAFRLHQLLRGRARARAGDGAVGRGRPHARARDHGREPEEPAGRREERGEGQRPQPAVRRLPVARPAAVRQHQLVQRAQLLRRPARPRRRHARGRVEVLPDVLRAEQRRAGRRRRLRPGADEGLDREVLRRDPAATLPAEGRHLRAAADEGEARDEGRRARNAPRARIGYHVPDANTPRVVRVGAAGPDPRAGQRLPALPGARRRSAGSPARSSGGINSGLGNMFDYRRARCSGTSRCFYDQDKSARPDPGGLRRAPSSRCERRRWTRRRSTAPW